MAEVKYGRDKMSRASHLAGSCRLGIRDTLPPLNRKIISDGEKKQTKPNKQASAHPRTVFVWCVATVSSLFLSCEVVFINNIVLIGLNVCLLVCLLVVVS